MKRNFLLLAFVLVTLHSSYAQQIDNYRQDTTTLFQKTKGFYSDPIRSKWRQEVKQNGDVWVLSLYSKKNILQEKITFTDKNLEERKGPYMLYKDGNLKEEGNYDKGYKHGEWKDYYANKQLSEKVSYKWDKLNGASVAYWDNGQLKTQGQYANGKKVGEWQMFLNDGKLERKEKYDIQGNKIEN